MPRQTSKLLVLLMILAVAPAAAGQRPMAARHGPGCPHDKARAAPAATASTGGGGVVRFRLFDWLPGDGFSLGLGRTSGPFVP